MEHEVVKLYIYDSPDESPKPETNAIIELYGIFYARRELKDVPVRVSAVKYITFVISFLLSRIYRLFDWSPVTKSLMLYSLPKRSGIYIEVRVNVSLQEMTLPTPT